MHGSLSSLNSHPAVVVVTGIALAGCASRELTRDLADVAIGTRFGNPRHTVETAGALARRINCIKQIIQPIAAVWQNEPSALPARLSCRDWDL